MKLCKESPEKLVTLEKIKAILTQTRFNSIDNPYLVKDFQSKLVSDYAKMFTSSKFHPILEYVLSKYRNYSYIELIPKDKMFSEILKPTSSKYSKLLIEYPVLKDNQVKAMNSFEMLKEDFFLEYLKNDQELIKDYEGLLFAQKTSMDPLENAYVNFLSISSTFSERLRKFILKSKEDMTILLVKTLSDILHSKVFPGVAQILFQSELNKKINFLDKYGKFIISNIFELLLSLNYMSNLYDNKQVIAFDFLKDSNNQQKINYI